MCQNCSYSMSNITLCVPQGSVLGQLDFILYINDMYGSLDQMHFVQFLDDTSDCASDSDLNNVHATVNRELVEVDNKLKANRLSLNVSRTSFMKFSNLKNSSDAIKVRDSILAKVLSHINP